MDATLDLKGATAIITGASSGIGAALAAELARAGCGLALADIDAEGLERVAAPLGPHAPRLSTHTLDVADPHAVAALPAAVAATHGGSLTTHPVIVVNNAGVSLGGTFDEVSETDFDWLLSINLDGVIRMTRAFAPVLHAAPSAQLVNLSSIFGIIAPPGNVAYATSKFAVRGFSEALRHEWLATNIGVTVVHPGGVATNIAKRARVGAQVTPEEAEAAQARYAKLLTLPPERAAALIAAAIRARTWRLIVGGDAKQMAFIQRLFPSRYWAIINRAAERKARA